MTVSYAETAEPIEMPFGMSTGVGLKNHAYGGGLDPPREGALLRGHTSGYPDLSVVDILSLIH